MKNLFSVQGEHTMIKTEVLILGVFAVFFMAVAAGAALLALPAILGRTGGAPGASSTLPAGADPTGTPVWSPTATPSPIEPAATTPPTLEPTNTPLPGATPTATPIPLPCDWAAFVDDVTVEDGTEMVPGEAFVKTWRLRNIGSCTWTSDYDLVFLSGKAMDAPVSVPLVESVSPGETVDVSVSMQAPDDDGTYTGYWILRNAAGARFGIGEAQSRSIWVTIEVFMPCYWAGFVEDVTVPDGTVISPGARFVKVWRLKNLGDCEWSASFDIVATGGDDLGATIGDLPHRVRPGETVDVEVAFIAPEEDGDYRGYWMVETDGGEQFGIGSEQDTPFWVDIEVLPVEDGPRYDFSANACLAAWKSGLGPLDCPGGAGDEGGFIVRLDHPALENRHEDEPALWTAPDRSSDGWITGRFPAVRIVQGDHFLAWVGCLEGSEGCQVTFTLDAQIGSGDIVNLGVWDEVYDGEVTVIDVNLSELAGENVIFILSVEVSGGDPEDSNAFWFAPRIEDLVISIVP